MHRVQGKCMPLKIKTICRHCERSEAIQFGFLTKHRSGSTMSQRLFKLSFNNPNIQEQDKLKSRILAFAITIIFRINAVKATIFFLPASTNRL